MKSNKGGLTGEVIEGTAAIFIAIIMFIIIESQGSGILEQEISQEVDVQMGDIRSNTVMSNVLNGKLHEIDEIDKGTYGNLPAYRIISYYFSTPGDKIYLDKNRNGIDNETVRDDIRLYLEEKMDKNFQQGSEEIDYYLDIQNFNNPEERPTKITVETYNPELSPDFRGTIYLANQEKIHINLYKHGEPFFFAKGD